MDDKPNRFCEPKQHNIILCHIQISFDNSSFVTENYEIGERDLTFRQFGESAKKV